ncbi:segregation/condensation protein A [Patescibacteria group bacterium]|nr:segregation/condensation protein A [Patescibacteria group bacterium]
MESQIYKVKTEHFEGPLDLLLNLIEKRKLFINDISLSKVADDFIAYINQLQNFPIAESAQFILIASTLLLIKSKSLLPQLNLTLEEEESIHDLEERLKLYQEIRELSIHVKDKFGKNIIFEKNQSKVEPLFSPDDSMTIPALFTSINDVLKNLPKKEFIPKAVVRKVVSLEEMIGSLTERIKSSLKMSFREFASVDKHEKVHVIVSFLAMLELVKQGVIMVNQENEFDDIHIETQEIGVPRYN